MKQHQKPLAPLLDSSEAVFAYSLGEGDFEILPLTDAAPNELMRVRQKAMRANVKNKNKRLYTAAVLSDAIERLRPHIAAGIVFSEYEHPQDVNTKGGPRFVDNPDRKTARVDSISDLDENGWAWIERTILNTKMGKAIADRFEKGNPPGISTRALMREGYKMLNGEKLCVPEQMMIHTFDDVESPAVDGAGEYVVLADSEIEGLVEANTNMGWKDCLLTLRALIDKREHPDRVKEALVDAQRAVADAGDEKDEALKQLTDMMAVLATSGYNADRSAPSVVPGGAPGSLPLGSGYAPDVRGEAPPSPTPVASLGDSFTPEQRRDIVALLERTTATQNEATRVQEVRAAIDSVFSDDSRSDGLGNLSEDERLYLIDTIMDSAQSPEQVSPMIDAQLSRMSKLLAKRNVPAMIRVDGQPITVDDGGNMAITRAGGPGRIAPATDALWDRVAYLCALADADRDEASAASNGFVSRASDSVRAWNIENVIKPMMDQIASELTGGKHKTALDWYEAEDMSAKDPEEYANLCDSFVRSLDSNYDKAIADSTTTTQLYNQPSIALFLMVQMFQDITALQFVEPIGPGMRDDRFERSGTLGIDGRIGSVLRWASETYVEAGAGTYDTIGLAWDAANLVPENTAIPEFQLKTAWTPFAALWKRIAFSITRDSVRTMGNGPLNYDVLFRHMIHAAWRIARGVDWLCYDEMIQVSDRYGSVAVTAEAPSLANQTVYNASGSITVNLNPTKTAAAAVVASTDQSVTYGTNVVAAIRMKSRGNGSSSPYMGAAIGSGPDATGGNDPIVKPQTVIDLNAAGAVSLTTNYDVSHSGVTTGWVRGELGLNNEIVDRPGATGANYAIDWENGVWVYTAAGVTNGTWQNSGGLLTASAGTTPTHNYTYATNFDNFIVNNPTLPTGHDLSMYMNGLMIRMSKTAAFMGSAPRYVRPDIAITTLNVSANIESAQIFYKLASPMRTDLFPSDSFFASRNGIDFARHNSSWSPLDKRILLTRRRATKYVIDTPIEMIGPVNMLTGAASTSLQMVARQGWYVQENSGVFTPQVVNQSGTVINPVARSIKIR